MPANPRWKTCASPGGRINTFGTILDLIRSEPLYNPNEQEFTVSSLTVLYNTLREKNKAVNDAQVALRNARLSMRIALYSEAGLFGTAKRVKKYVLFAFGATSDQFRTIRSISLKSR